MRAVLAFALLLAGAAAAQTIEVAPLAPPAASGEEEEAVAPPRSPSIEFKQAPFRDTGPKLPEPIPPVAVARGDGAVLRLLDLMTAETRRIDIDAGQTRDLGRLSVRLDRCERPEDGAAKGARAGLPGSARGAGGDTPVFAGWMFADSPALSAMDHRRYDLWVISCTTVAGSASSGSE